MTSRALLLALRGALMLGGLSAVSGAIAQGCTAASGTSAYPRAVEAVRLWEQQRGVGLTAEAEADVLREFCNAAGQLVRGAGLNASDINADAPAVIQGFLDENASAATATRSLSSHLAAQFGLGAGPALPGPRAVGRILITYRRPADSLLVAGKRLPAYPVLISRIGQVTISGLLRNAQVCRGRISVIATVATVFTCE